MKKEKNDILQALKTALEAELTGHAFYRNAAENTVDPMGKKTFLRMAEEEMGHFNYLRRQYKAVMETGDYDFSTKLEEHNWEHAENPIFSEALKARIKESHFEVSALTIGMKLEMDAVRYYTTCAQEAEDPEAQHLYGALAEWEQDHYLAFKRQLEILKEEYFQANQFIPM